MRRGLLQLGLTFALCWGASPLLAEKDPPKTIRLRESHGTHYPATIRFWVWADPAETLRYIAVAAYDADGEKVTESGKAASPGQRLYTFADWRDCPFSGEIRLVATAWWDDGTRQSDQKTLLILAP